MKTWGIALVLAASSLHAAETGTIVDVPVLRDRVEIPEGWFSFGSSAEDQNAGVSMCQRELAALPPETCVAKTLFLGEATQHRVWLPAFAIDRYEVTIGAYRRCADAGHCDPRPVIDADPRMRDAKLPVAGASWFDADRYCRWAGGTLPSELEWERAARGKVPRVFPWGDAPLDGTSNRGKFVVLDAGTALRTLVVRVDERDGFLFTAPPGSFPSGASPDGVQDLAGNVAEWVADAVGDEGPVRSDGPRLPLAMGARRMMRGGSFRQPLFYARTTAWDAALPETRSPEVGFRCVEPRAIERR